MWFRHIPMVIYELLEPVRFTYNNYSFRLLRAKGVYVSIVKRARTILSIYLTVTAREMICVTAFACRQNRRLSRTWIQSVEYNLSRIYSRHRSIETDTGTGDLWKTFMKIDAEDAHVKEASTPIRTPREFDARTRGTVKIAWIEV